MVWRWAVPLVGVSQIFSWAELQPTLWIRFQDDIFGLWPHGQDSLLAFHDFLNRQHRKIQLDLTSNPDSIRFLDLEIYRHDDSLFHRIGFKITDSHRILAPTSYHPSHTFRGILYSQVLRWSTHSSTREDFQKTAALVCPVWRSQGYTRTAVRSAIRKVLTITGQKITWGCGFFPCQSNSCEICSFAKSPEPSRPAPITGRIPFSTEYPVTLSTLFTSSLVLNVKNNTLDKPPALYANAFQNTYSLS